MSDAALLDLARQAGIATAWTDFRGRRHAVAPDTLRRLLAALDLPCDSIVDIGDSRDRLARPQAPPPLITAVCGEPIVLPETMPPAGAAYRITREDGAAIGGRIVAAADGMRLAAPVEAPGYHVLEVAGERLTVAVAPRRAPGIADLLDRSPQSGPRLRPDPPRAWALAAQLYGLRKRGDGGLGSYGALADLATGLAAQGADALAVSPVHAMFSAQPGRSSPYSPSSRLLYNALHVHPREAFGADAAALAADALGCGARLEALERDALIDWSAAGGLRLALLRRLFDLGAAPLVGAAAEDLPAGDEVCRRHARFEALHAHFLAQGVDGWRQWPAEYRDPGSAAIADFARTHAREVEFHALLQRLAAGGLARAQAAARAAGMPIGLIADLAIGSDPEGSHAWSRQGRMLARVSIGAPPDPLAPSGQSWGLTTLSPTAMRDTGYAGFIELLRACMAHAGGVRIDHVLGLLRLWLVPEGAGPEEGAYLAYPCDDLLRLVALESWRQRCLVVGEDLGTVPPGFRERLSAHGIHGMRVLWFERDADGGFVGRAHWPTDAMATTTTHDLATSAGWWLGDDLRLRHDIGQIDAAQLHQQQAIRDADRTALWRTLCPDETALPPIDAAGASAFVDAAVDHVAGTPSALAVLPLEDALGLADAPNVPGTRDEHPNWRRRLPSDVDATLADPALQRRLGALGRGRASASPQPPAE